MSVAELLEPLYRADVEAVTTFGFRLPSFRRGHPGRRSAHGDAASAPFAFGPFAWSLEVHAGGNGPCAGTHVSAFVALVTHVPHGVSVSVPLSMTVLRTDGGDPGTHVVKGDADPGALPHEFSAANRRIGWPDLVLLGGIGAFLDPEEGLIVHVAMGKPAQLTFTHPITRSVMGSNVVFDTPSFNLADHKWFLRINPHLDTDDGPFVSMHVMMCDGCEDEGDASPGYTHSWYDVWCYPLVVMLVQGLDG